MGHWQWAIAGNSGTAAQLGSLAVDARGYVAVAGYLLGTATLGSFSLCSAGSYDLLIGQLEAATGTWRWRWRWRWRWLRRAGGPDEEAIGGVACDTAGHVFITGSQASRSARYGPLTHVITSVTDAFVTRLDANGTFQWVRGGGSYADNSGDALAVDAQGAAYVTGRYYDAPALLRTVAPGAPAPGFSLWPQPAQGFVRVQGAVGAGAQPFVLRTLLGATVRTGTLGPAPARLDLRGRARAFTCSRCPWRARCPGAW